MSSRETQAGTSSSFEMWLSQHKRLAELLEKDDWVTVWSGTAIFCVLAVNASSGGGSLVWNGSASNLLNGLMTFLLLLLAPLVTFGWRFLGGQQKVQALLPGFAICFGLALLGRTIGKQSAMKQVYYIKIE